MIFAYSAILLIASILPISTMASQELSTSINSFSGELFHQIAAKKNENLITSPLSVHTVLSLLATGAGGNTATQLRTGLHQTLSKEKTEDDYQALMTSLNSQTSVVLEIANHVYAQKGYTLKPEFKEIATKKFFAGADNLDFTQNVASAKAINTWVEEKTHDKIHDLISADALGPDTRMVLVNALYLKGEWEKQFNKNLTETKPFYISETETKDVEMMYKKDKYRYAEFEDLDAKAIELSYRDSNISMLVILPNTKTGLPALEEKLRTKNLQDLISAMYPVDVQLHMPKFRIETEINLNEVLKALGMTDMFEADKADFSGLLDTLEHLYVSDVVQKAYIEVNEEGAEAAAATATMIRTMAMPMPPAEPKTFNAEHPFVYILKTPEITMFYGHVNQPK